MRGWDKRITPFVQPKPTTLPFSKASQSPGSATRRLKSRVSAHSSKSTQTCGRPDRLNVYGSLPPLRGVMDRIVYWLLAGLDGMSSREDTAGGVFVLGVTNRPNLLD
ncbi:hypothetical protein QBC33DRAFT_564333 [Phialemonium atrogriseum]|uniref:ATPase AAA-type core domain-containing protein n=1 Tax=Phialemonium atrogriseum TaxID=1093897 RepID=A0AAJ0BR55_9PEZI|nr:uncharacterized protein QBC33DRAFT_564333 [Phialemonium atrogriseum]KAK1761883.1 hypothetical protein QBC33DRAFT_564333 [Phialemonium atrogriseum]